MDVTWSLVVVGVTTLLFLGVLVYAFVSSMMTDDDYSEAATAPTGPSAASLADHSTDDTVINRPKRRSVPSIPKVSPSEAYSSVPDQWAS